MAQDEATSVVYGMAQEAVRRGVVNAIVPLGEIAERLCELTSKEAHAR
jgi:chemotaxis response regulator CheB